MTNQLLTRVMLLTFRANGALLSAGDALVAPFGLTSSRWQVLGAIHSEPLTVSEIARVMGLTRQSVQRTADALAEEKFASYGENPNHARAPLLSLTAKGRSALVKATEAQKKWSAGLARSHTGEDLEAAIRTLEKLVQSIENQEGKNEK